MSDSENEEELIKTEENNYWNEFNETYGKSKNKKTKGRIKTTFGRIGQQITPQVNIDLNFNNPRKRRVGMWICIVLSIYWLLWFIGFWIFFFLYASEKGWLHNKIISNQNSTEILLYS